MTKVDLNAMLGDWQAAGYSEAQAQTLAVRLQELNTLQDVANETARGGEIVKVMLFPALLAQAMRDVPPDLGPPPTVREYEVDPDEFLAVYRDEGVGPMKLVGVEYQAQSVGGA